MNVYLQDSGAGCLVHLKVDPNGYILYWREQNKVNQEILGLVINLNLSCSCVFLVSIYNYFTLINFFFLYPVTCSGTILHESIKNGSLNGLPNISYPIKKIQISFAIPASRYQHKLCNIYSEMHHFTGLNYQQKIPYWTARE